MHLASWLLRMRAHIVETSHRKGLSMSPSALAAVSVVHQTARVRKLRRGVDRRQLILSRKPHDKVSVRIHERLGQRDKSLGTFP